MDATPVADHFGDVGQVLLPEIEMSQRGDSTIAEVVADLPTRRSVPAFDIQKIPISAVSSV